MKISKLISAGIILFSVMLIALILGVTFYLTANAKSISGSIGNEMGTMAGVALGSFDGVTKGIEEGKDDGRTKGLSAEETAARIANEIHAVGRLRVLDMNVTLSDVFSVGAEDNSESSTGYFALLTLDGTASYTVDLEQCIISIDDEAVKITIPRPELRITIDPEKTQKRAENNASAVSNGSSFDGYTAYINSLKKATEKIKEQLTSYGKMKEAAEKSAISAVERLASSVRIDDKPINVEFANDNEVIEVVEKEVNL